MSRLVIPVIKNSSNGNHLEDGSYPSAVLPQTFLQLLRISEFNFGRM